jgi:hypothetical protein
MLKIRKMWMLLETSKVWTYLIYISSEIIWNKTNLNNSILIILIKNRKPVPKGFRRSLEFERKVNKLNS